MPIGKGYGRSTPAPKGKPSKPKSSKVISSKSGKFKPNMPHSR